jgi:choline dehydrogenase-like flavoprotein
MADLPETVDVAIIDSGIGGSTIAYGLAGSGARIAILERGFHLGAHPAARDARAIFRRGVFRPVETWLDSHGRFNPGNYYYVGGNSKFYGGVLIRYPRTRLRGARTLGWRFARIALVRPRRTTV